MFQICLGWELGEVHKNVSVIGFRILVNGEQLGHLLDKATRRTTIDKLKPGECVCLCVEGMKPGKYVCLCVEGLKPGECVLVCRGNEALVTGFVKLS